AVSAKFLRTAGSCPPGGGACASLPWPCCCSAGSLLPGLSSAAPSLPLSPPNPPPPPGPPGAVGGPLPGSPLSFCLPFSDFLSSSTTDSPKTPRLDIPVSLLCSRLENHCPMLASVCG